MPITKFKTRSYDLQDEINRKVLDTLDKVSIQYTNGELTEHQVGAAMSALYSATYGLVDDESMTTVMDSYEPTVTEVSAGYFIRLRKLDEVLFVTWQAGEEFVVIHIASEQEKVTKVAIPASVGPHEMYNRVLERLFKQGWEKQEL